MGKRTRAPNRTRIYFSGLEKRISQAPRVRARFLKKEDIAAVLETFLEQTMFSLVEFEEIYIRGFGQFYRMNRNKQIVVHPKTRETTILTPRFDIRFKVGLEWKRILGKNGFRTTADRLQNPVKQISKKKKSSEIPTDM